jgi:hypothetical protein
MEKARRFAEPSLVENCAVDAKSAGFPALLALPQAHYTPLKNETTTCSFGRATIGARIYGYESRGGVLRGAEGG